MNNETVLPRLNWGGTLLRSLTALLGVVAVLFLLLPLVGLLWRGINAEAWSSLTAGVLLDAIRLSLLTTALSLALTFIFGTPLAYALARRRIAFSRWINVLIQLPIVLPPAVAGLALLSAFGQRGLLQGPMETLGIDIAFSSVAVVLAQTFVAAPFYLRAASVGFQSIPREVEEAARVDGADSLPLFVFVILPLARRSLGAGLVLTWARALGEFGATLMFAGSLRGTTQTMPLLIYDTFQSNIEAAILAGLVLVGVALVTLLVSQSLRRNDDDVGLPGEV